MADVSRGGYPPTHDYNYQQSPARQEPPREDGRSSYPLPPDPSRQGQYPPPPDPSRQGQYPPAPQPYPPPQQWAGQPQGQPPYPQLPPPHHYDPQHAQYHYPPPPPAQPNQPPAPHDPYRLPPPPVYAAPYHYQYQAPPPPAPRQRTAIACKYCRKRKIRCSGYDSSPDGRCQNCVRFNQQCLFHPVSSQAAFVPASALYGPGARAPMAGGDNQGQNGQPQPMLYGAHGQPLGPAGPGGQPQYGYPPSAAAANTQPPPQPQGYAPPPYPGYPPHNYGQPPPPVNAAPPASGPPPTAAPALAPVSAPPTHYDQSSQQAPPPTASSDRSDRGSLKRGPPDEDPHNETNGSAHSPHPNARPRYDGRPSGSHDYQSPTSPANSTMSYQSYPPNAYSNGIQTQNINGNNSPPSGLTPNSIHSLHSPHSTNLENRTPPPPHPGSSGSSQNSRSGMRVHEMLGGPNHPQYTNEQRARNDSDNDMLSKLNGRK